MKAKKTRQDNLKIQRLNVNDAQAAPTRIREDLTGDEAPGRKDFLLVLMTILILIVLSWAAYHFFGWGGSK